MNDEPLIYTTKGNVPIASLKYRHEWQEDDNGIYLIEEYTLDGEIVKKNVHARLKQGIPSLLKQQTF